MIQHDGAYQLLRSTLTFLLAMACIGLVRSVTATPSTLTVIPHLSGFGTHTVAGSGRHLRPPRSRIIFITNLNDSGRGTLRSCAEGHGPRTCIPLVGGVVRLSRAIRISSPYLTIAGQSAPFPGITLTNGGIILETHDVLIQHITIRPGDAKEGVRPGERDGISIGAPPPRKVYNVVIDHVSLTWALDENISTAYPLTRDVTISNSIIAQGLHNSIHPKGPHSKGIMIGDASKNISVTRNLIAFNEERNPYVKPGSSVEFINNVVYGWGSKGGWSLCNLTNNTDRSEPILLTFVGNVYRPAPYSALLPPLYAKALDPRSVIYARDNRGPISEAHSPTSPVHIAQSSSASPPVSAALNDALPIEESLELVLSSAGARPAERDSFDTAIVTDVRSFGGTLKDCTTGCARSTGSLQGTPRTNRSLRLPRRPFGDRNRDGYTNLENWLQRFSRVLERTERATRSR